MLKKEKYLEEVVLQIDGAKDTRQAPILETDVRVGGVPAWVFVRQCIWAPRLSGVVLRRQLRVVRLSSPPCFGTGTQEEPRQRGPLRVVLTEVVDEVPGAARVRTSAGHEAVPRRTCVRAPGHLSQP